MLVNEFYTRRLGLATWIFRTCPVLIYE